MKKTMRLVSTLFMFLAVSTLVQPVRAEDKSSAQKGGDAGLAQELSNPVADLISVPFQMNYDCGIGPLDDGWKLQTNIQPVVPFSINDNLNLITRTIMPVIYQDDIFPGAGSQFGLGDINMSLFFSPKKPTSGGLIWGAGPVLLFPTATESLLGGKKWGAGPALVALTMRGQWTMGMPRQPRLVLCRRQRPPGYQQHLCTAICGVHMAERLDRIGAIREHLQLEDGEVVCTHQCRRCQAGQMGQVACQPAGRGRLLGGIARNRT
jgi:hypothetical protein